MTRAELRTALEVRVKPALEAAIRQAKRAAAAPGAGPTERSRAAMMANWLLTLREWSAQPIDAMALARRIDTRHLEAISTALGSTEETEQVLNAATFYGLIPDLLGD